MAGHAEASRGVLSPASLAREIPLKLHKRDIQHAFPVLRRIFKLLESRPKGHEISMAFPWLPTGLDDAQARPVVVFLIVRH